MNRQIPECQHALPGRRSPSASFPLEARKEGQGRFRLGGIGLRAEDVVVILIVSINSYAYCYYCVVRGWLALLKYLGPLGFFLESRRLLLLLSLSLSLSLASLFLLLQLIASLLLIMVIVIVMIIANVVLAVVIVVVAVTILIMIDSLITVAFYYSCCY